MTTIEHDSPCAECGTDVVDCELVHLQRGVHCCVQCERRGVLAMHRYVQGHGPVDPIDWVEHAGRERCEICGERWAETGDEEIAEMWDRDWPDDRPAVICHAQCGIDKGYDIA